MTPAARIQVPLSRVVLSVAAAALAASPARSAAETGADCAPDASVRRSVILTEGGAAAFKELRFDGPGLVAVAVSQCGVEVLPQCRLPVRAPFEALAPTESAVTIEAPQRLREALPAAAPDLLRHADALMGGEVRSVAVGRRRSSRPLVFAAELVGDCRRATHLVTEIVYGAVEVRGPAPDRLVYDGNGDREACLEARADKPEPAPTCRTPVAMTMTRLAPNVLVAPNAHDPSACKEDDPVGCTTACALGNASGCTSLARQLEKAAGQVTSAAEGAASAVDGGGVGQKLGVEPSKAAAVAGAAKNARRAADAGGAGAAAALYGAACLAGQSLACNNLGVMREQGRGGAADPGEAALLYEAACLGGLVRACNNLGTLLREGKGRPVNRVESLALFRAACQDGEPAACVNLGQQQLAGLGVPPDAVAAVEAFRQGCESGETTGCEYLAQAASVAGRLPEAAAALKSACQKGVPGACAAAERLPPVKAPLEGESR